MRTWIAIGLCALFGLGCGGAAASASAPAAEGVRVYLTALKSDDPKAAYSMLSAEARKDLTYKEFQLLWKESRAERHLQAAALEEGLDGDDDLGERAQVKFPDGKTASLHRESGKWRLESALLSQSHAGQPRDAVRIFAEALEARDFDMLIRILTTRRGEGIRKQLEAFTRSLRDHLGEEISNVGKDRAELQWDDKDTRYKIVLYKDGDEWRVDDVHIRPAPEDAKKDKDDDKSKSKKKKPKKNKRKP